MYVVVIIRKTYLINFFYQCSTYIPGPVIWILLLTNPKTPYSKDKDQPSKVANPACGQLNRENEYFSIPVSA